MSCSSSEASASVASLRSQGRRLKLRAPFQHALLKTRPFADRLRPGNDVRKAFERKVDADQGVKCSGAHEISASEKRSPTSHSCSESSSSTFWNRSMSRCSAASIRSAAAGCRWSHGRGKRAARDRAATPGTWRLPLRSGAAPCRSCGCRSASSPRHMDLGRRAQPIAHLCSLVFRRSGCSGGSGKSRRDIR